MSNAGRASWVTLFVALVLCLPTESRAGFERRFAGARSLGTGGALCSVGEDPWSFYFNPARAAQIRELNIFYVPSVLGVEEVKATGLAYRDYLGNVDIGASAQTFGFDLYRESVFSLNVSMPVYEFLFVGMNLNGNHVYIDGYGTDFSVSVDAGARMFLSDHFSFAFGATNVNSASMTVSNDRLPQTFSAGIAFQSSQLNVGIEYFKELGFPSSARIAAEYSPIKFLILRCGSASGMNTFNAGISLKFLSFELEYGAAFHQVLGTTQSFGLSIRLQDVFGSEFEKILDRRKILRGE